MTHLFAIAVQIVAVATFFALLVGVFTRMVKNPPLAHILWLLVLVKLVTPPFVCFELWNRNSEPLTTQTERSTGPASAARQPIAEGSQPPLPLSPRVVRNTAELDPAAAERPNSAVERRSGITVAAAWHTIVPVLMGIWLCGAGLAGLLAALRIVRFHRMLGGTLPASRRVQSFADDLADRMGLRRSPDIRVINVAAVPFVWGIGGRSKVVLPRRLLDALDEQQTAMVLAHELAHLRRRDHWVRLVELVASVLHWWNPLVWWVRRRLHSVEEQCCDAWAKWVFPNRGRDYAECLLKAAELSSQTPLPIMLASPFRHDSGLKERIEMILQNRLRRSVSRWGAICLVVLAAVVVPVGVQSAQRESDEAGAAGTEPAPPKTDAAKVAAVAKKSAATGKPIAKKLQPFQGTWKLGACESLVWHSKLRVVRTWKWVIQHREITWFRPGEKPVKMSFDVDAGKSPQQIDLEFLNGPNKGKICHGIYRFDQRGSLWVCITDPEAMVARPTEIGFRSDGKRSLLILQDRKKPAEATGKIGAPRRTVAGKVSGAAEAWTVNRTYKMRTFRSDKWPADVKNVRAWKWTFRGRVITWSRPGVKDVTLSFTVDATKSPKQINLTFLNGPDKGHTCRGSYIASRHHVWLCFQDPGAKVRRPKSFKFKSGGRYTTISMIPERIASSAEEVDALQGMWEFDMCTTDWWPHTPEQRKWRWHVEENVISWTGLSTGDVKLSFTLNPETLPRQIDLTFLNGPRKGEKLLGIYQAFSDNTCQFCLTDPVTKVNRPNSFSYSTGKGRTLIIVKKSE